MKHKTKPRMDDPVKSIGYLIESRNQLARQAEKQYAPEVDDILRTQCRNIQCIEHLLDGMLDFGFDESIVRLYKKLCRYYFEIDAEATAFYINSYREMWDEEK